MTASHLLEECRLAGVALTLDGAGRLAFKGDKQAVNRLLPAIKANKPALLAILTQGKEQPPDRPMVTVWTPAGTALAVQADSPEHAEWLARVNPRPEAPFNPPCQPKAKLVLCIDCQDH